MEAKFIHCSYHKCLTSYFCKVFDLLYNRIVGLRKGYRHFNSVEKDFYLDGGNFQLSSLNNHVLDFENLNRNIRITRFIRDPRDLVVSGYFYHTKGFEYWTNIINPRKKDFEVVNGCIPQDMGENHSFSSYLKSLNEEDGLIAEIEFRKNHFSSMLEWPGFDKRIKLFRYEDILGNEIEIFRQIFAHYEVSWFEEKIGLFFAGQFTANRQQKKTAHIRNPKSGQWKQHFSPRVNDHFNEMYKELLERYNYRIF